MNNWNTEELAIEFKDRLKALREVNGLTQEEFADYVGVSRSAISGYETKGYQPSHEKLVKIAEKFEVSIDFLLSGSLKDDIIKLDNQKTNERLVDEITKQSTHLSFDNKKKALEYIRFLEYSNSLTTNTP